MTSPTRAGDRDRESTATLLGQALAEGYLDLPEYENRLQTAFTAQTAAPAGLQFRQSRSCRKASALRILKARSSIIWD